MLVETMAAELSSQGHEIVLVSRDTPQSLSGTGINQWIKKHIPWNCPKPTPKQARQLAEVLAEEKVDVAHFHSGGCYGWGNRFIGHCPVPYLARHGIPCFSSSHLVVNLLTGYCGPRKPLWFKLLLLPVAWLGKMHQLFHVRAEITVSRHDDLKLRRWFAPLRRRFVQIYHSKLGTNDLVAPLAPREKVIINVGHLAARKGQTVLAEAFVQIAKRHPGWRLEFAGKDLEDTPTRRIQALAREHGLEDRILLLGERADILPLLRRSSIYVQPSFEEALGLALQEAMACGCAVIGTRIGGIPELIENPALGILVEAGDVPQLADALESLIIDAARREHMGRAASAFIRECGMTADAMTHRHLELYESLCTKF